MTKIKTKLRRCEEPAWSLMYSDVRQSGLVVSVEASGLKLQFCGTPAFIVRNGVVVVLVAAAAADVYYYKSGTNRYSSSSGGCQKR